MRQGEIVEGRGGLYTVRETSGEVHVLRAKKKFRREDMTPLPGDRVLFVPRPGEEHGWLEEILPRSSLCLRPPVANIQMMVIVAAAELAPDWMLMDKLILFARVQGITPLVAVNKCDLGKACYEEAKASYRDADIAVLSVSAATGEGLDQLKAAMQGSFCCLAGQSGVGKSALLSRLLDLSLVSGEMSQRIHRGKQTTRHTTLLFSNGLKVLDTPGFSLLEMPQNLIPEDLPRYYPECEAYTGCRFQPCLHLTEPGCMVRKAQEEGLLSPVRMARYRDMMALLKAAWKERFD